SINFRAWDGTIDEAQDYYIQPINSDNCEVEAYSCIDAMGTIVINPVNDHPVINIINYNTDLDQYSKSDGLGHFDLYFNFSDVETNNQTVLVNLYYANGIPIQFTGNTFIYSNPTSGGSYTHNITFDLDCGIHELYIKVEDQGDVPGSNPISNNLLSSNLNLSPLTVREPGINLQNSQMIISEGGVQYELNEISINNGCVDGTINSDYDLYIQLNGAYEWSSSQSFNNIISDNINEIISINIEPITENKILKININPEIDFNDDLDIILDGLYIETNSPISPSSDNLILIADGITQNDRYVNTENDIIIIDPTITIKNNANNSTNENLIVNSNESINVNWKANDFHIDSLPNQFLSNHSIYLKISDAVEWDTSVLFSNLVITSDGMDISAFFEPTIIWDTSNNYLKITTNDNVVLNSNSLIIGGLSYSVPASIQPIDNLDLDIRSSDIQQLPPDDYYRNSLEWIAVGNPEFQSQNGGNLFVVGDNTGVLQPIEIQLGSDGDINPIDDGTGNSKSIFIKINDETNVNFSDSQLSINVIDNSVNIFDSALFISPKILKIEINDLSQILSINNNLIIDGISIEGLEYRNDNGWDELQFSFFSNINNPYLNGVSEYHDEDNHVYSIAVGQPKVYLNEDAYFMAGDTPKAIGDIIIENDQDFDVINSSFMLTLPNGGIWDISSYVSTEIIASLSGNNPSELTFLLNSSFSLNEGSFVEISGLKAELFDGPIYPYGTTNTISDINGLDDYLNISINGNTNYPIEPAQNTDIFIQSNFGIFTGEPSIQLENLDGQNDNISFSVGQVNPSFNKITIRDDLLLTGSGMISSNDTMYIILPDTSYEWVEPDNNSIDGCETSIIENFSHVLVLSNCDFSSTTFIEFNGNLSIVTPQNIIEADSIKLSFNTESFEIYQSNNYITNKSDMTVRVGNPQIEIDNNYPFYLNDQGQRIGITIKEDTIEGGIDKDEGVHIIFDDSFNGKFYSNEYSIVVYPEEEFCPINSCIDINDDVITISGFSRDLEATEEILLELYISDFSDISDSTYLDLSTNEGDDFTAKSANWLKIGNPQISILENIVFIDDESDYVDFIPEIRITEDSVAIISDQYPLVLKLPNGLIFNDSESFNEINYNVIDASDDIIEINLLDITSTDGTHLSIDNLPSLNPNEKLVLKNIPISNITNCSNGDEIEFYPIDIISHNSIMNNDDYSMSVGCPTYLLTNNSSTPLNNEENNYIFLMNDINRSIKDI
ncbi:MAG: hypothetical protein H8E55_65125, partial [Pelagibacterales bacterium]|nr:hypothetical protein [Pelagibacterales bacterium]